MKPIGTAKLEDGVRRAMVVAHKEDAAMLERALAAESFVTEVVRGPYSEEQPRFPPQIRDLINRSNAWKKVLDA